MRLRNPIQVGGRTDRLQICKLHGTVILPSMLLMDRWLVPMREVCALCRGLEGLCEASSASALLLETSRLPSCFRLFEDMLRGDCVFRLFLLLVGDLPLVGESPCRLFLDFLWGMLAA